MLLVLLLLHNFRYCGNEVKCSLFKSFRTNMYSFPLWFNSTSSNVKKLKCSYNLQQCFTSFVIYTMKPHYANEIFVTYGIPSIYELLHKCIYNFSERIRSSRNSSRSSLIVIPTTLFLQGMLVANNIFFSPIRRWWRLVLF